MRLTRSLTGRARSLYRFAAVRKALLVVGPARWRLPRTLRWRLVFEGDLRRQHRRRLVRYGYPERVVPPRAPSPAPTLGHTVALRPYRVHQPFAVDVGRVWLVGRHATPVTTQGRVLLTPYRNETRILGLEPHPDVVDFIESRRYEQPWPADAMDEPVFSTVSRVDENYAHWLVEICGELEGVRAWSTAHELDVRLLVRAPGSRFHAGSLDLLGFGGDQISWSDDSPPLAVERLIVSSMPGTAVAASPRSVSWLRRHFLRAVRDQEERSSPSDARRRIYIRRRKGGWRSIANADEVEAALHERGFDIVAAEDMTFRDQVELFAAAELVVAQHGSGLTNLLFAPSDCRTIELFGDYGDGYFAALVTALGQGYDALSCAVDGDDTTVDVPELLRLVDRRLAAA